MTGRGSNRLAFIANEARQALDRVLQGEESAIGGWLAYGHALIEGRELHKGDTEFGRWLDENSLRQVVGPDGFPREINDHERAAAIWAAANPVQFEEARQRGNPRTIRGIHAKWKEIEAEREAEAQNVIEAPSEEAPQDMHPAPDAACAASYPEASEEITEAEAAPEIAKERREVAKLTAEALVDEVLGLRADLRDEKARRKKAEAEAREAKAKLKDFEGNQAESIRRLQAKVKHAESERFRTEEKFAAEKRKAYALNKEIERLRKQLEAQEIALN